MKNDRAAFEQLNPSIQWEVVDAPHLLLRVAKDRAVELVSSFLDALGD